MNADSSLEPTWVLGFTGHRHLHKPEAISEAISRLLSSLRAEIPGQLVGYSSVAIGADTLFAEACLKSGIPWTAILPRPRDDFKSDFSDSDWARTSTLLRGAARVESLPPMADKDLGYLESGLATVEEADLLIAVWDQKAPRGTGGTAEVVAHARSLGKPIILVNPERLDVVRENFSPERFADDEMTFLNSVAGHDKASTNGSAPPREQVRRFFHAVDKRAAGIAPRFRAFLGGSVILNALAAILTAASVAFRVNSRTFQAVIFALVAAAALAVALMKRREGHRKWLRCRVAAEICRSYLATWDLGNAVTPFWFSQLEGFDRLTKSIRLLQLSDQPEGTPDLEGARARYLKDRIDPQLRYFRHRRRKLSSLVVILTAAFWIFSALALGRSIMSAFAVRPEETDWMSIALHSFLPIALPLAAGCVLSLISIFDLNRQLARAGRMESALAKIRTQIEKCQNLVSLRHAVKNAENAFAGEIFEWFTLFKSPRFN